MTLVPAEGLRSDGHLSCIRRRPSPKALGVSMPAHRDPMDGLQRQHANDSGGFDSVLSTSSARSSSTSPTALVSPTPRRTGCSWSGGHDLTYREFVSLWDRGSRALESKTAGDAFR